MKTAGQIQTFLVNPYEHVSADCDPDLCLDRILVGAKKRLDSQMLFDQFEEQLDLSALAVKACNRHSFPR